MKSANEKILSENIERLDISCDTIKKLQEHEIKKLEHLCKQTKTKLKELGLATKEIDKIEVELQLLGLNLK